MIQDISNNIPQPSILVRKYFDLAIQSEGKAYRSLYAVMAIGTSIINSIGYGIVIPSRIAFALIQQEFKDLTLLCKQDASYVFQSLYFTAAMTAYLFLARTATVRCDA